MDQANEKPKREVVKRQLYKAQAHISTVTNEIAAANTSVLQLTKISTTSLKHTV